MLAKIEYVDGSIEIIEADRIMKEEGKIKIMRDGERIATWLIEIMGEDIEEITIDGEEINWKN